MHRFVFRLETLAAVLMALVAFAPVPAGAAGALALGQPQHIEKLGVAIGNAWNYKTREEAAAAAVKRCTEYKGAPKAADLCGLTKTYENQCYSIAMDPKAGTPGFGWAIMDEQAQADEAALSNCRSTAGRGRAKFCKVTEGHCDTAKDAKEEPAK
jgi:hypothetical protein